MIYEKLQFQTKYYNQKQFYLKNILPTYALKIQTSKLMSTLIEVMNFIFFSV